MKKQLLVLTLTLSNLASFSQSFLWGKNTGGTTTDIGTAVVIDASGNVYTTGSFSGTSDFDPGTGTFNLMALGSDGRPFRQAGFKRYY